MTLLVGYLLLSAMLFAIGLALFYLWAGAEFVSFAQMIVYVGAVSMVTLFAVLLTRRSLDEPGITAGSRARASAAITTAGAVAGVLSGAIATARFPAAPAAAPTITVRQIGLELMGPQAAGLLVVFIWIRATLPRLRMDQLMHLAWKFLVPLALLNLGTAAFWSLSAGWAGPLQLARWALALALVAGPFFFLGRGLTAGLGPRTYRFAPS